MPLEGRWTVFVCTGCGECTGRHNACDAKREATPVVPCDDAAVERGMRAVIDTYDYNPDAAFGDYARRVAEAVLRAAGEAP